MSFNQSTLTIQKYCEDYERNFIDLIEKVTCGSVFKISETGTRIGYRPGIITGGNIVHECFLSRGIGYYLEPILALAPFAKEPLSLTLKGVTNCNIDLSVDTIRTVLVPLMSKFNDDLSEIVFKINKRGAYPKGGGEVFFSCPCIESTHPVDLVDSGSILRIRGIAYSTRVSPQISSRIANAARKVFTRYIPDVYIFTDSYKGESSGLSPGYALTLVASSTTGSLISSEFSAFPGLDHSLSKNEDNKNFCQLELDLRASFENRMNTPEDLAKLATSMLLSEISYGGYIDNVSQWIAITLSVFNSQDASTIKMGKLTNSTITYLKDLYAFLKLKVKIETELNPINLTNVTMTIPGIDYTNKNIRRK